MLISEITRPFHVLTQPELDGIGRALQSGYLSCEEAIDEWLSRGIPHSTATRWATSTERN